MTCHEMSLAWIDFGLREWNDPQTRQVAGRSHVKTAGAEQSNQSDDDQINGDNVVQQPGYEQYENAGDQRNHGTKGQGDIHGMSFNLNDGR